MIFRAFNEVLFIQFGKTWGEGRGDKRRTERIPDVLFYYLFTPHSPKSRKQNITRLKFFLTNENKIMYKVDTF